MTWVSGLRTVTDRRPSGRIQPPSRTALIAGTLSALLLLPVYGPASAEAHPTLSSLSDAGAAAAIEPLSVGAAAQVPEPADFVAGAVVVAFDGHSTRPERRTARSLVASPSASDAETIAPRTELLELERGVSVPEAVDALRSEPGVRFAEPNYYIDPADSPNDPEYQDPNMWWAHGDNSQPAAVYGSQAAEAWSQGFTGSRDTYVAVIDTGVDISHPDLASNIWTNADEANGTAGVDDDNNGFVDDLHGWDFANNDDSVFDDAQSDRHGTHVAGTVAAEGNNGLGVVGINWAATVIPVKFLDEPRGTLGDVVQAIDYVTRLRTEKGLNVAATNNSWKLSGYSRTLRDAIRRGGDAGITFVAAAGNSGTDNDEIATYPASYDCATA